MRRLKRPEIRTTQGSIHENTVLKAVKKAGMAKRPTPHAFPHSFATHKLENHCGARTVRALLGHKDAKTTMIHTHVLNRGGLVVLPPLARGVTEAGPGHSRVLERGVVRQPAFIID